MSFYTGKYNGSFKCHITKGAHDIVTMRGAPFSNTIFHTDIKYMDYLISDVGYPNETISAEGYPNAYGWTLTNEIKYYLKQGYAYMMYDKSLKTLVNTAFIVEVPGNRNDTSLIDTVTQSEFEITVNINRIDECKLYGGSNGSLYAFVFYGVDRYGNTRAIRSQDRTGEIKINRNQFTVGDYDVLNFPYINPSYLNNVDYYYKSTLNKFGAQFINSVPKNPGLQLISKGGETTIKAGGQVVISTNGGNTGLNNSGKIPVYKFPVLRLTLDGSALSVSHTFKISDRIFNNGDVMLITMFGDNFTHWSTGDIMSAANMSIIQYQEGDIEKIKNVYPNVFPGYNYYQVFFGSGGKMYMRSIFTRPNTSYQGAGVTFMESSIQIIVLT